MEKFNLKMILFVLLFGFIQQLQAQHQTVAGLYLTPADYLHHRLSYIVSPADSNGDNLYLHEFMGANTITVVVKGKKEVFEKNKLYGYHDTDNHDYRFFDRKTYQIADTAEFYLYSREKLMQQGKGAKTTNIFYFSKKAGSEIVLLTAENIGAAFTQNYRFKYMVEVEAKSDIKLDAYDNTANEFKIKELYKASLKN